MNLGKTNFFLLFSLGKANLKNYKNRSPMKKISCQQPKSEEGHSGT